MSQFLGPIHHWMFAKIKLVDERIDFIKGKLEPVTGPLSTDPSAIGGGELEALLGGNAIHSFLQGLIDSTEKREAKLVAAAVNAGSKAGNIVELILSAAREHGELVGKRSAEKGAEKIGSVDQAAQFIMDVYLDGMPCDRVSGFIPDGNNAAVFAHSECLHARNWQVGGADKITMCMLVSAWLAGVLKTAAPNVEFSRETSIASGDPECRANVKIG